MGVTNFTGLAVDGYAFPKVIEGTLQYSDFGTVNGTVAVGTIPGTIPAGATFIRAAAPTVTGFTGSPNTWATATIGDATDVDRYSGTGFSVFATAAGGVNVGSATGTAYHNVGTVPQIRVTVSNAYGSITAGAVGYKLYYFD